MKKKWLVLVLITVLFVGIVGAAVIANSEENVTTFWFDEEINVVDGEADITEHSIPFTLTEDDTYVVHVKWTAEKPGLISGVTLCNDADEILFYFTGDTVDAESIEFDLEAGEYYAKYIYFTNEEAFDTFTTAVDATVYDETPYDYAENESFTVTYHFNINRAGSVAYNAGLLVGMLVGVGVGLLLVALAFKFVKVKKGSNFAYDERQQMARGRGFKYAYVTSIVYNGVLCLVTVAEIGIPVEQGVLIMFGIMLSVLVYAVYCILHDAYVSLNENANRLMIVFIFMGGINLLIGIMHIVHGTMVEEGILTFHGMNLFCGILLLVVAVVLFGHTKLQSGEEE